MNFDRRYALCIQKLYHRPHFTVGGNWIKSLHLQPLQRCYCENSGSSRSGPGFDSRSGQVSWVRFFRGFSSPVRQMSGSFRPPRSPNIIWPSLSSIIIHYGRQWPEMLTSPKASNIHTNSGSPASAGVMRRHYSTTHRVLHLKPNGRTEFRMCAIGCATTGFPPT